MPSGFKSVSHKIRVSKSKGPDHSSPVKVELIIEIAPEHHHVVKDLEFRQANLVNFWQVNT